MGTWTTTSRPVSGDGALGTAKSLTAAPLWERLHVRPVLGQTHDVAEDVRDRRREQRSRAQEEVRAVEAEQASVSQLEHWGLLIRGDDTINQDRRLVHVCTAAIRRADRVRP